METEIKMQKWYATYLYPKALPPEHETFEDARETLTHRLVKLGFTNFNIPNGGRIPGPFWAMECHFAGTRDEVLPDLPEDLVNPQDMGTR